MDAIRQSTTGMCPKCQVVRNFRVDVERLQARSQDGTLKTTETSTAHCETCGSFISRQSREVSES